MPHGYEAFFVLRVVGVAKGGRKWIVEDGDGLIERDAMLCEIRGSLVRVPLEAHHAASDLCLASLGVMRFLRCQTARNSAHRAQPC